MTKRIGVVSVGFPEVLTKALLVSQIPISCFQPESVWSLDHHQSLTNTKLETLF